MDWDELDLGDEDWDGQDWEESCLSDYLFFDYWSPHIALHTLSGFDYQTCMSGTSGEFTKMNTLNPPSFMSYQNENAEDEEELLTRMNEDLHRLHHFWKNSGLDSEDARYAPAFFIEWALAKRFKPHWLDWAIGRKLYIPKREANKTLLSDTSLNDQVKLAMDLKAGAGGAVAVPNVPIVGESASAQTQWHLLATPGELIAAFGSFTGMDKSWFKAVKDKPQLLAARYSLGVSGRGGTEPFFYVFPVMQWLIDPKRKTGRPMSVAVGWRMLKTYFPKVYEPFEDVAPDAD